MARYYFAFFILLLAFPAHAQKPYEVENVKINLKGVNPVEARDQAFEEAQTKAFKALFRSLNNGAVLEFDESRIPSLIQDFELIDEQIAPNRYAATYTFRFKRLASEELAREAQYAQALAGEGGQFGDNLGGYNGPSYSALYNNPNAAAGYAPAGKPPLLLPYWKVGQNVVIWGQGNEWQQTWKRLENATENGTGFILPIGDLTDMRQTSGRIPETRDTINQLLSRYQVQRIVVAVGERASGSITTTLYRADKYGLTFWKVIDSPIGPQADPYSVAAGQVMAEIRGNSNPAMTSRMPLAPAQLRQDENSVVIEERQPEPFFQAAQKDIQSTIRVESRFNTPKEWLELKASMIPENGIHNVRVISLTPKSAMVELQLSEPIMTVQQKLGDRSVALKENAGIEGSYIVKFMGS